MPHADVLEAFAAHVARLHVSGERVKRLALVGDLGLALRPTDGAERMRSRRLLAASHSQWMPSRDAGGRADETAVRLCAQRVQSAPGAVDEHGLAARVAGLDGLGSCARRA